MECKDGDAHNVTPLAEIETKPRDDVIAANVGWSRLSKRHAAPCELNGGRRIEAPPNDRQRRVGLDPAASRCLSRVEQGDLRREESQMHRDQHNNERALRVGHRPSEVYQLWETATIVAMKGSTYQFKRISVYLLY